ncbi:MAG: methyltransferase domain-containing protein [Candidatus Binataceae bacterium]|jgi:trans-aconitate 2-methyltransferase
MTDWDPELYHRFRRYRAEPVELIFERLAIRPNERIADLGCGTGEHTVELARRSEGGCAIGIDSSPAMIANALKLRDILDEALRERVSFVRGDFTNLTAVNEYTIIFSNAALHWARDQRHIFAACFDALKPGGRLVVQLPANGHETAQFTVRAMAAEAPWRAVIAGDGLEEKLTVLEPEEYRAILTALGFTAVDCYYHVFHHPMESPGAVVEWSRATVLRRVFDRLPPERHQEFLAELERRLAEAYGTSGPLTFNFRRLFIWASRPS